jgi:multidrug resistance efflux pump
MGKTQLRQVARTCEIAGDTEFRSPVTGLVVARNAFSGLRFDRGSELFRIADLSHVSILADFFENDARLLRALS